ncbi:hypothetical protein NL676_007771 [Syzygium grande]|nr:hypothetical protein NL676_007771 [Syzygium grande]
MKQSQESTIPQLEAPIQLQTSSSTKFEQGPGRTTPGPKHPPREKRETKQGRRILLLSSTPEIIKWGQLNQMIPNLSHMIRGKIVSKRKSALKKEKMAAVTETDGDAVKQSSSVAAESPETLLFF